MMEFLIRLLDGSLVAGLRFNPDMPILKVFFSNSDRTLPLVISQTPCKQLAPPIINTTVWIDRRNIFPQLLEGVGLSMFVNNVQPSNTYL